MVRSDQAQMGRYYTDSRICDLLIASMGSVHPRRILDLGSGGGSLAAAARRMWRDAEITTVDIDPFACSGASTRLGVSVDAKRRHIQADALELDVHFRAEKKKAFDAAICNPPYAIPRWRVNYEQILEDAGFAPSTLVSAEVPSDILFLAQTIRLTRNGGPVGFIVPEGLIAGSRTAMIREILVSRHRLERVIQLPLGSFKNTEARTHILVLRKGGATESCIELSRLEASGRLAPSILIDCAAGIERLDYSFHADRTKPLSARKRTFTLISLGAEIVRGSFTSKQVKCAKQPVFHVGDFSKKARSSYILKKFNIPTTRKVKGQIAQPGDILIARVGRTLRNKICAVGRGRVLYSEWIFRVRVPKQQRKMVFDAMNSQRGQELIETCAHGVGAKHISKQDLLHIKFEIDADACISGQHP